MVCRVVTGRVMGKNSYQPRNNLMASPAYRYERARKDHVMHFSDGTFQKFYPVFVATGILCGIAAVLPGMVAGVMP